MGNKSSKQRADGKHLYRSNGLYPNCAWNQSQVKQLIKMGALAPRYPGVSEADDKFNDECPICFFSYPALNRSDCCGKLLCTECFLQLRKPGDVRQPRCPFCNTQDYVVRFWGPRSPETRELEALENRRVVEAQDKARAAEAKQQEEERQLRLSSPPRPPAPPDSSTMHAAAFSVSPPLAHTRTPVAARRSSSSSSRPQALRPVEDMNDGMLDDLALQQAIQLSIREVQRPHQMQEQVQDQEQQRRQPPPPTEPSHQQQFHLPASGGRSRGVTSTPLQQNDSGDDHDDDDNQDEELQIALRLSMSDAGQQ